jgi:hypothetical protein
MCVGQLRAERDRECALHHAAPPPFLDMRKGLTGVTMRVSVWGTSGKGQMHAVCIARSLHREARRKIPVRGCLLLEGWGGSWICRRSWRSIIRPCFHLSLLWLLVFIVLHSFHSPSFL